MTHPRQPDYDQGRRLFALASANGALRLSMSHLVWDHSEDCEAAVFQDLQFRPYVDNPVGTQLHIEQWFRCGKCRACLASRRRTWMVRALRETSVAYRTWMGTLTLAPKRHYHAYASASARLALHGIDIDTLSPAVQFNERHKEISKEITRYVKRVRKGSGPLRFLLVAEKHRSGLPHYHMLIHEKDAVGTREQVLSAQWTWGFSRWRVIAEKKQATYLCKYLGKELGARVRASQLYGKDVLRHSAIEDMRVTTNDLRNVVYALPPERDGGRSPRLASIIGPELIGPS